jgi:iron-only hydrogenase group A
MSKINRREFIEKTILLNGFALFSMRWLNPLSGLLGMAPAKLYALPIQEDNPSIVRLHNKCKGCADCIKACTEKQNVFGTYAASNTHHVCIHCGSCIQVCTKGAMIEKYQWESVMNAIDDPSKIVIASISPSVRVGLGDYFGMPEGTYLPENMVGACRAAGFDYVLDVNFSADLTIMEEAKELQDRIKANSNMPQFTSCCPAWVKYVEIYYPSLLKHLSTAKSPNLMQGAMVKTYFAKKKGIDPKNIVHVAITPCTAKKFEISREEFTTDGMRSMDFAITTNELAMLLKKKNIDLASQKGQFDSLMSATSGAGIIFGNTGGVMRAAVRTAYYNITGKNPPADLLNLQEVQGLKGIKEASVKIGNATVNVAVCYEMRNAKPILEQVKNGTCKYHFIEVMACTGGCVGGAGQPADEAKIAKRIAALDAADVSSKIRFSHENPEIKTIYKKFLGKVGGEKAEHYLHTSFVDRSNLLAEVENKVTTAEKLVPETAEA